MTLLEGRKYLLTGGGGRRSIGFAITTGIVGNGGEVIVVDVNKELIGVYKETFGEKVIFFPLDITVKNFFTEIKIEQIDGLINNAAIFPVQKFPLRRAS